MRRRLAWQLLAAALLLAIGSPAAIAADARPNVLVIVTDDQSRGTVTPAVMPFTYRTFVERGRSYPNFTVSDPLCCPSRAAIMTGRYGHSNGVKGNGRYVRPLDHASTVQRYLHRAGYRTGQVGRFFNGWPADRPPPYFDFWATAVTDPAQGGARHVGVRFNTRGRGVEPILGWADDYIARQAAAFIARGDDARPWFLYVAPTTPHAPYAPRPAYATAPLPALPDPPVEADLTDKHPSIARHQTRPGHARRTRRAELRLLMGTDDLVQEVMTAVRRERELAQTLVVYVSDNGYMHGEHGLLGKRLPYTAAVSVPFHVHWRGHVAPGSTDDRLVSNVDIAPTILAAAGFRRGLRYPLDGRDVLDTAWQRGSALLEHWRLPRTNWHQRFYSLRTADWQYIEYRDRHDAVGFREYYDLDRDPYELDNVLADDERANDPAVATLHRRLERARRCAGRTCPGMRSRAAWPWGDMTVGDALAGGSID
jgi:arylsulfatase A-like enzyme